jgi:predicted nucleic acid-binding protein
MVNDSITIAMMKNEGIENLATNDLDFKKINEIKVFTP